LVLLISLNTIDTRGSNNPLYSEDRVLVEESHGIGLDRNP